MKTIHVILFGAALSAAFTTHAGDTRAEIPGLKNMASLDRWTPTQIAQSYYGSMVYPVLWANQRFYIPGSSTAWNTNTILSSANGTAWAPAITLNYMKGISAMAYANNAWMLGFVDGLIMTSPDGTTWTTHNSRTQATLTSIAFGNGTWVIKTVGQLLWSTDMNTWTQVLVHNSDAAAGTVIFANNQFVATSAAGSVGEILTSPDGRTWTSRSRAAGYVSVAANAGGYVAVGNGAAIATSPDGVTWTARQLPLAGANPVNMNLTGVTHGRGGWVTVGKNQMSPLIYSSTDGITWTSHSIPATTMAFNSVQAGDTGYVATASDTSGKLFAYSVMGYPPLLNVAPGMASRLQTNAAATGLTKPAPTATP